MAYPEEFDWGYANTLNLDDFRDYCIDNLEFVGSGSARIAFMVDENIVLKVASNVKGIAQNKVEASVGNDGYVNDIFAGVLSAHPKYWWIEMNICVGVTAQEFENMTGVSMKRWAGDISEELAWSIHYGLYQDEEMKPARWEELKTNPFIMCVLDYIRKYDIHQYGDICSLKHWGLDNTGKLVLMDYGITNYVWNNFYMGNSGRITSV